MEVYKLEESKEEVTMSSPEKAGMQRGAALEVRPIKSFEVREGE